MFGVGNRLPFVKIPSGAAFDQDAQAFFTAAGITDNDLKTAYNTFVLNLKTGLVNSSNLWTDVWNKQILLLTSGDASKNTVNLRNPGTFNGIFVTSPTHASTGVTLDGSTQYIRSGIIVSEDLTLNNVSVSAYVRNNVAENSFLFGVRQTASNRLSMAPRWSTDSLFWDCYNTSGGRLTVGSHTDGSGLITGTRRSATDSEAYRNASSLGSISTSGGDPPTTYEIYIGANNQESTAASFMGNELLVTAIGEGITDDQNTDWNAAVAQLKIDLGI